MPDPSEPAGNPLEAVEATSSDAEGASRTTPEPTEASQSERPHTVGAVLPKTCENDLVDTQYQRNDASSSPGQDESLTRLISDATLEDLVKNEAKRAELEKKKLSRANQKKIYEDISRAVCKIKMWSYSERPDEFDVGGGTGFLVSLPVGKDIEHVHGLLTNHHVIPHRPDKSWPIQLDFEKSRRSVTVGNDDIAGFYTRDKICKGVKFSHCEKLDATFITFTEALANSLRDVFVLEMASSDCKDDDRLVVVGHPAYDQNDGNNRPMKIEPGYAMTTKGSSFFHQASTLKGASGSPVLNDELKVVGLHRLGLSDSWVTLKHRKGIFPLGYNKATHLRYIVEDIQKRVKDMDGCLLPAISAQTETLRNARRPDEQDRYVFDFTTNDEKRQWAAMLIDDGRPKIIDMGVIILPQHFGGFIMSLWLEKREKAVLLRASRHQENPPNQKSVSFQFRLKLHIRAPDPSVPDTDRETQTLPSRVSDTTMIRDLFTIQNWKKFSADLPPTVELFVSPQEDEEDTA